MKVAGIAKKSLNTLLLLLILKSSYPRCTVEKGVSQISGENTCVGVFFNKVAGLGPSTLLEKIPTQLLRNF